jgi:CDP-glycerol glycerophosphotransferase (TagB/SpsB family)
MKFMRSAAFNTGLDFHLLDHIAPLAELKRMPLITTEELNYNLACKFYPQVEIRFIPDLEFRLKEIAEEFDALYECKFWQPHLKLIFRQLFNKDMRLIFCPHGQSDKGYQTPLLAPCEWQDEVLVYGSLMIEMLNELNIRFSNHERIGNYRFNFYLKYQTFYDDLAAKEIPLDRSKPTLLYAPTWKDADGATSFFDYGDQVIRQLPTNWNLILKTHPLLQQRNPAEFHKITSLAANKPNLVLIDEFPPVYPILSMADFYLGDASSVGYDFLTHLKPLYFLPTKTPGRLHRCGTIINPNNNIYLQLEKTNPFIEQQKALYRKAFLS